VTEELITRREEVALISDEYFTVTVTGLVINGEPTVASWKNLGKQIKGAEGSILWNLGDWANFGEVTYEDYAAIRDKLGYTTKTVKDAKLVASAFKIARRRADLSWSFYREALSLASDGTEADELLERAAEEDWTIKKLRKEVSERNKSLPAPLPEDKFNVILADPPWQYDFSLDSKDDIEVHYPTLTVDEIGNIEDKNGRQVKDVAAEQTVLFLWATAPKIREALEVMDSWGFEYKTNAVWDKEWIGMGYWFRGRHELLLVGTKGSMSPPGTDARYDSVIRDKRGEHSVKPEKVYEIIEFMYPEAQRLELFARKEREGWTSWGNEVV